MYDKNGGIIVQHTYRFERPQFLLGPDKLGCGPTPPRQHCVSIKYVIKKIRLPNMARICSRFLSNFKSHIEIHVLFGKDTQLRSEGNGAESPFRFSKRLQSPNKVKLRKVLDQEGGGGFLPTLIRRQAKPCQGS